MDHQRPKAPVPQGRLCFSLDEKVLYDMHHHHYYSSSSSYYQPSEQSHCRATAPEPITPPFAPPRREPTPDGIPSWPPLLQRRAEQPPATIGQRSRKRIARILGRILVDRNDHWDTIRARIRWAIGLNLKDIRKRHAPARPVTAWRPTMSGHSTFRFGAVETHPFSRASSPPVEGVGVGGRRRRKEFRSTESSEGLLSEDAEQRGGSWERWGT